MCRCRVGVHVHSRAGRALGTPDGQAARFGLASVGAPKGWLGSAMLQVVRPGLREELTALRQIERLGYARDVVRDVVVTHLDIDHAGGIGDFPAAAIHLHRAEREAATAGATFNERNRYRSPRV